jgi:hypothetical protein
MTPQSDTTIEVQGEAGWTTSWRIDVFCEDWQWVVRVNGIFVASFWRKRRAYELAHRLSEVWR